MLAALMTASCQIILLTYLVNNVTYNNVLLIITENQKKPLNYYSIYFHGGFMTEFEMDFEVLKNSNSEIIGFQLQAKPHTESEIFCASFPYYLSDKKAKIVFKEKKIVFDHSLHSLYPGACEFELTDDEFESLSGMFERREPLFMDKVNGITPGFKLVKYSL